MSEVDPGRRYLGYREVQALAWLVFGLTVCITVVMVTWIVTIHGCGP